MFSVCFILLFADCTANDEEKIEKTILNKKKECKYCEGNFWSTKFTHTHIQDDKQLFKVAADELTRRRRKGRLLEFINHDEVYFKNLTVDQVLNTRIVKFDMGEINHLVYSNVIQNQDTQQQADFEDKKNELNRVLGDKIKITFLPADNKNQPIVLTAAHATILIDAMTIRFQGNVSLAAAKCKIHSAEAIWSNVYNGLYFSEPFQFNNKNNQPSAFFRSAVLAAAIKCTL